MPHRTADTFAAIDLGSNSFHMIVARAGEGGLQIVDRLREPVRMAEGMGQKGHLTEEAKSRALAALERFGERLRDMPGERVRAVGTNALRRARDKRRFMNQARKALGHGIEVLPGREEARLIYLGVAHSVARAAGRRLVVDIGGGSTELILGDGFDPEVMDSLFMGCVSFSESFFPKGRITREHMRDAVDAARIELETCERRYQGRVWESAVGASGSVLAIEKVLVAWGLTTEGINAAGLKRLRKELVAAGGADALELGDLSNRRRQVLPGAVAILTAIFEALDLAEMATSQGALREGLIYDLVGRKKHEDVRDRTISALMSRYHVDEAQAKRVEDTAQSLFDPCVGDWARDPERARLHLGWAARLHEIGLAIAYTGHHKHGAYILAHSDLPGFSRDEQAALGALVRGHRRKLPPELFDEVPEEDVPALSVLVVLLRLAKLLNRSRVQLPVPTVRLEAGQLTVAFADGWLDSHPLTRRELELERKLLKGFAVELVLA